MQVVQGHLTQTERRHIAHLLANNISEGTINKKSYSITKENEVYTVVIKQKDRGLGWIGSELRISTYTHKFTV